MDPFGGAQGTSKYSQKVIELLLKRDRSYLSELLGTEIPSNATVDTVCAIIANQSQADKNAHVSSIYKCKCGSKMVTLREVQIRSADEGSTIIHVCNECGNKW